MTSRPPRQRLARQSALPEIRPALLLEIPALNALIRDSARELSRGFYDPATFRASNSNSFKRVSSFTIAEYN